MRAFKPVATEPSFFITIILIMSLIIACSSDETEERGEISEGESQQALEQQRPKFTDAGLADPGYEGWKQYFDEFVIVYFPPDSALQERVPAIATTIKRVVMENAYRLHVRPPTPFVFYLYNNTTEVEQLTDCSNTCVRGNVIHYMTLTPLGQPIMIRLLPEFDPDGTPYKFVYEGIVTLLDYSRRNYVQRAYIDLYNGELPSMATLLENDEYMAVDSATRVQAAASFLQYLTQPPWAPDSVLSLYKSDKAPDQALLDIFGRTPQDLEEGWHEYLRENSGLDVEY
ncbi:MAG TPA: hypothetical protein ENO22_06535 [candidate division Zixibacteria bacterium]|nr:hypothetical protein [candidate division Zixibacteria bacterium]HEQ98978.1 hypothetical protein [candidate division Zixibacteria bacterium]